MRSLVLVLALLSLSLAAVPASVMLEELEAQLHNSPVMLRGDFIPFDTKRSSNGFWSKFLDKVHEEKRGKYYGGGNNYADAVFRGLG